jgi:Xaa-Pro aminopeptidase
VNPVYLFVIIDGRGDIPEVHERIPDRGAVMSGNQVKTDKEIVALRQSGRMLATVLETMRRETAAGRTPKDMSAMAKKELEKLGGEPASLAFSVTRTSSVFR